MEKEKNVLRNKSIGTKVSDDEYAALEKLAEARGLTLGEWLRELVLGELIAHPAEQIILAEILALRMLYLNTVQILGRGEELTIEKLRRLIERVDEEKQRKATERLAGQDGHQPGPEK
ncbi:MAG: plasmid mobilization protein [Candidatus Angelobacter sp.]